MNLTPTWTDERIQTLKDWQVMGLSASQIATQMHVTRNAIIGKLHRLGIVGKKPAYTPRPKVERRAPLSSRRLVAPAVDGHDDIVDLPPDTSVFEVPIGNLRSGMCRYPLGEPSAEMLYCGAASHGPWCPRHRAIVYKPAWARCT